ncbi:MAG TPA: hypothetical protein VMU80_22600 [Bryobacteraceae bacterium]|nr:hypothetical protein [Bryobacteraceae bacterium]
MADSNWRHGVLLCSSAALLLSWGCGYIGEPLPPLLNIPQRTPDVIAAQLGSNIEVRFALPIYTTEGQILKQDVTTEVRIGLKPAGQFNAEAWATTAKTAPGGATVNGAIEYLIPVAGWVGKDVAIAVKIVGLNGRDAGWSNPATLTVVPPPEKPRDLTAAAAPDGVHLTWQGTGDSFAVLRRGPDEKEYSTLAESKKPDWMDTTAQFGKPYSYVVRSLVKAGTGEAGSELSNEAAITPIDTFAPATPTGLTAVPSTSSIELVWERSTDNNLAGYRVYRALGDGPFVRISDTEPLPTYSDHQIESGKTYRYAVTAVKKNGKESARSAVVQATAP